MAQVKFYRGLKEKYNESTHLDGIYFATDTFEIIVNNKTYGGTKSATVSEISYDEPSHKFTIVKGDGSSVELSLPVTDGTNAGLMSAEDKKKLDAVLEGFDPEGPSVQEEIDEIKAYTVNGQKITENPVIDGSNVSLTGYSKPSAGGAVAPTDKVNDAIGKLEYDLDTAESTLEQAVQDINDLQEQVTTNKVEAADKSVVVTPSEGQKTTIRVNVKSGDNALKLDAENGLYVDQSALTSYEGKEAIAIADKAESEGVKEISLKINANDKVLTQAAEGLLANINLTWSTTDGLKLIGKNSTEIASIPASDFIKDGMLQSVELKVASEDEPIGEAITGTFLVFTFNVDAGSKVINVNVTDLIDVYTASTGIKLEGKNFMAVIDPASEAFLTVGADGIKLSGVQNAINSAKATVDAYTVNAKAISSNPVLSGADIALTGYSTVEGGAVAATDTINQAINKLDDALIWHEA